MLNPLPNYSQLDDKWTVDVGAQTFVSQMVKEREEQRLIFSDAFSDGEISGKLIWRDGIKMDDGGVPRVVAFAFRVVDPSNYYYAGIGAFGNKFHISRKLNGKQQNIASRSTSSTIEKDIPYNVTVRCEGSRITLLENGVVQVTADDNSFQSGHWGLRTWRTSGEYTDLTLRTEKPRCFVIMPFSSEFNFVRNVIRQTVESYGFRYDRADERFITEPLAARIQEQIATADLIIADLTGKNPNVFYEVGYAAAIGKRIVHIAQSAAELPFDVKHLRTFIYSNQMGADVKLREDLTKAVEATTGMRRLLAT